MRLKSLDVIVTMIVIVFLAGVFAAAQKAATEEDKRNVCASNLRQIGQAIFIYQNENKGAYPRTICDKNDPNPVPVWGTPYESNPMLTVDENADPFKGEYAPKSNDVTAGLYLLMRTEEITTNAFVCPSSRAEPFLFGGGAHHAMHWTNWPGNEGIRKHLSYSYLNAYPSQAARAFRLKNPLPVNSPLAADMNPGSDALLKLSPTSTPAELRQGNSLNHDRAGQNVLFFDGHVDFVDHPFVGEGGDNIYTYGKSDREKSLGGDGIAGAPAFQWDSILLPTARDIAAKPTR